MVVGTRRKDIPVEPLLTAGQKEKKFTSTDEMCCLYIL